MLLYYCSQFLCFLDKNNVYIQIQIVSVKLNSVLKSTDNWYSDT